MKRDAEQPGGSLESGTTTKQPFHDTSPDSLGMGLRGDPIDGPQKPKGPVDQKAPRGHTIR